MRFRICGSLGDEVALTALVREYRLQFPRESLHVEATRPELFSTNPHLGDRQDDNGRTHSFIWASNDRIGNLVHAYAQQVGGVRVYDTRPELHLSEQELQESSGIQAGAVAIDTWAGWPRRRWPFERYVRLVDSLRQLGRHVIEVGASTPDCFGQRRSQILPNTSECRVDRHSIRQTAALLANCSLFIGADSGLVHVAAAVGTRQVALYAVPWYARAYPSTFPLFSLQHDCLGCNEVCHRADRCIDDITPADVMEMIRRHSL